MRRNTILASLFSFWFLILLQPLRGGDLFYAHKSEADFAKMTPENIVNEYCKENQYHQALFHDEYDSLLDKYLRKANTRTLPAIIRIIDEFQPSQKNLSAVKEKRFEAAGFILGFFDKGVFRLKAFDEGKTAIQALKKAAERMQVKIANAPSQNRSDISNYESLMRHIKEYEGSDGIAGAPGGSIDRAIVDTLRIQYQVNLSEKELNAFLAYLIAKDPFYPSWSARTHIRENEKIVFILKEPKPYYDAYLAFTSHK